jgi:NTP pyrophosphatase (non-canonical NTP hydrolase)
VAEKNCLKYLPEGSKILDYRVEENGLIFSDNNNIAPPNVLFLGRFATWNHADKQQDVIRAAKVDFELQNVWNIQKRFTSNFVDFNSLKDVKDRERLTKDYFVALMPELTEVINEINYKQHKQGKKVNRELLLEELIDTFKYYLNILLMWDITPDEFVRKFKEKSQKVQDMYESGK